MGVQKYNVPSSPSQLPLQGRLEGPEEKMSTENMASAEQVRGGCSDLWVLLSQFLESLCYKGNSFCRAVPPQVRNKGWVELGTDPGPCSSAALQVLLWLLCQLRFIAQAGIAKQTG